jgi:hypothetical protein
MNKTSSFFPMKKPNSKRFARLKLAMLQKKGAVSTSSFAANLDTVGKRTSKAILVSSKSLVAEFSKFCS